MGVLEQITDMKGQGTPDEDIITILRQQGFSNREIKDAIDQAEIKNAVSNPPLEMEPGMEPPSPNTPSPRSMYTPQTKEIPSEETYPGYSQQEEYGYKPPEQEFYQGEGGYEYPQQAAMGTDIMIEIAEQVFSEKMKKMQKNISELVEFKTLSQAKIENISERVKRIEELMDRLQAAILERIGSYGRGLESIKKEMSMMQDSFGKMIPSLAEKEHKTRETSRKRTTHKKASRKK